LKCIKLKRGKGAKMGKEQKLSIEELKNVPETLLYPLKSRYVETKKKKGVIRDPLSVEILDALDYDPTRAKLFVISQIGACLRTIIFDEQVAKFLKSHPDAVVVNIGCGLDTRFPRIDNGTVLWFDLDLPESIQLRRRFFHETDRHRFIEKSAIDPSWADEIPKGRPVLFIVEGLSFYFTEEENRKMLGILQEHFPGSHCLIEIMAAWYVNMVLKMMNKKDYDDPLDNRAASLMKWGLNSGRELEAWSEKIKFIEEWFVARKRLSAFPWHLQLMFCLAPILTKSNKVMHLRFA
jgi:O-methyltransferase involved in polyketide biosynthesis